MDYKEILGEELFNQVTEKLGDKKLIVNDGNWIPKDKFNEKNEELKALKSEIASSDTQLSEMKNSLKGNEEFTKTIEDLQKQNQEWEGKYKNSLIDSQIKLKAQAEKAKDASDVVKFLDMSKVAIKEDGSVEGLDEQFAALKENKSYLFEVAQTGGGFNPAGGNATDVDITKMSMDEYMNHWNKKHK